MDTKSHAWISKMGDIILCFGALSAAIAATPNSGNTYLVHNLVSDLPGMADFQDPNRVNPWGIAASATSPFWIGNNGTGTSTIYSTNGTPNSLVVNIPAPTMAAGCAVSGVIANATTGFSVTSGGTTKTASFLFCTEDGTIAGWNTSVNATNAIIALNQSASGAAFKGCAVGGTAAAPVLTSPIFIMAS